MRSFLCMLLLGLAPSSVLANCPWNVAKNSVTLLAVADDGTFSGTSESAYYDLNVQKARDVKDPKSLGCFKITRGMLLNQPVILVGTGIGPVPTATCFTEIFSHCGDFVKEVIYTGTSGWSPMVGGLLNSGACGATRAPDPAKQIHFGDICVTDYSVNWEAKKAEWSGQCLKAPNVCAEPLELFGPEADFLYGKSIFYDKPSVSTSLIAEITSHKVPGKPAKEIVEYDAYYWGNVSMTTKLDYTAPLGAPAIYSSNICVEADGQFFYSGHPWEGIAREYVAETLNLARGTKVTKYNVIAVAAMEAVAWMPVVQTYNSISGRAPIPYTTVRAASNHLAGAVKEIDQYNWRNAGGFEEDFGVGYGYAIKTGGTLVLETLKARCLAQFAASGKPDREGVCQYVLK